MNLLYYFLVIKVDLPWMPFKCFNCTIAGHSTIKCSNGLSTKINVKFANPYSHINLSVYCFQKWPFNQNLA